MTETTQLSYARAAVEQASAALRTVSEQPSRMTIEAAEWKFPPATIVAFVYDERPCLNLMRSLIRDARRWPNLSIWDKSKDALISRARSDVATDFLKQGNGDVLIMVDHDIGWEPGDLEHLTRVCLDLECVVGGVFPKRGFGLGVPIRWGQYGEYVVPDDRVVECSAVATGFFAVHRKVLEAMAPTLPMTTAGYRTFFEQRSRDVGREDGLWDDLSEDYDFCEKARALGFKVFADLRPQLTHFGSHLFSLVDSTYKTPDRNQPVTLTSRDPNEPLTTKAGFKLWVDADDQYVSDSLIRAGEWEPETSDYILANVREGDVIVEVGSHLGAHTVPLAADPRVSKVVAVEPLPAMVNLLRRNVAANDLEGKVDIWPMAMVHQLDTRKTARMLQVHANPGASHLLDAGDEMGVEVPTVRLGDLGVEPDILKLDAEGAEYLILEGDRTSEILAHCRLIVTEYCDAQLRRVSGRSGEQYLDLLEELGFDTGIADRAALPKGSAYCNIVALRRDEYPVPGAR